MVHTPTSRGMKVILAIASTVSGAALVIAAFKVDWLNWMVDGPGWLVSRFVSTDFHEGDGVFGFLFAVFLSWLCLSLAAWFLILGFRRLIRRA
jgi:hypothetical protein